MATALRVPDSPPASRRPKAAQPVARKGRSTEPTLFGELLRLALTLSTPMPFVARQPRCECASCTTARATSFRCTNCGHVGTPMVGVCRCDEEHDSLLRVAKMRLEQALTGKSINAGPVLTVAEAEAEIERLTKERPIVPCADNACGVHGFRECQVCICADFDPADQRDREHVWKMIREARSILYGLVELYRLEHPREIGPAVRESRDIRMRALTDAEGFSEVLVTGSPILAAHSDKLHLALPGKATAQETVHAVRALAIALLRDSETGGARLVRL